MESFQVGKAHAYGKLPSPSASGKYLRPSAYVNDATRTVRLELRRAGVRLAKILNESLH
jgi:hypothetical protein